MEFVFDFRSSDAKVVENIWHTQSEQSGTFTSEAVSNSELVVTRFQGKTTITMRGPETKASIADFPADAEFFGMTLKLGTYMPQFATKNLLNRRDVTLPEAGNHSFWLNGSVWELPSFDNADTFVTRLMREGLLVHDPVVDAVLGGRSADLSPRAVQYRFLRATGLTITTIRQIDRARRAMSLLRTGFTILDTAYEAGYFDQAHLTNSLRRFLGQTPSQILSSSQSE